MANNRIYLRCRGCGDVLYMGKSFLEGFYYLSYDGIPLERKLNDFYDEHNYCDKPKHRALPVYDEKAFPLPEDCSVMDGCFDIVYEDALSGAGIEVN
jgi:hypothetical protein